MIVVDILLRLGLLLTLTWCLGVLVRAVRENSLRGRAPVHRGTSWQRRDIRGRL